MDDASLLRQLESLDREGILVATVFGSLTVRLNRPGAAPRTNPRDY